MTRRAVRARLVALLVPALLVTGCAGSDDEPAAAAPSTAGPTATPTPDPAPTVGTCHRLTLDQAASATASEDQDVPCGQEHTAVTVAVAPLDVVADGHLLSLDSDAAQARLRRTCAPRVDWAGGDETTRRLSRLQVVWFTPSPEQLDLGADWVRCDLVAVGSEDRLLPLPARARGLLDRPGALDTFGTCGTASPAAGGFARVACSEAHRWRAVDVVDVVDGARFLGEAATDAADATCQDVASERSGGSLELTWAFEWPTREQWRSGQRWGWCWVPETA